MTAGRSARIWNLVAAQAARHGGPVSAADACAAAVAAVDVTGAWLIAARGAEAGHLMHVTDQASELLAELQLTLGEGPGLDAAASGGPVLASDLDETEAVRRWPAFAPAARRAGAAAIFAFPLQLGAIRTGVMSLYRVRSGPLSAFQLGDALIFADTATLLLLDAQDQSAKDQSAKDQSAKDQATQHQSARDHQSRTARSAATGPGGQPADLTRHRAEIDQATGMLTEQLGVGIGEAFIRMRAYAYAHDRRLSDLARDIVARRLRLSPDPDPRKDAQG